MTRIIGKDRRYRLPSSRRASKGGGKSCGCGFHHAWFFDGSGHRGIIVATTIERGDGDGEARRVVHFAGVFLIVCG